ncbi:unnamed protein product [Oikopleura dioica]|uniref:Uncharacterized protein n=1 Tax=Oikopleura dioica TaxID=34765 RepID=E4YAX8_OIKDI|nr:unnamed protein product [Oikopleura dioica]
MAVVAFAVVRFKKNRARDAASSRLKKHVASRSDLLLELANGYSGTCRTIDSSRWTTGLTTSWAGAEMPQLAIDFDNDNKFEDFVLNDETYILVHFLVGVDQLTLNPYYPINQDCIHPTGTPTGLENTNGCLDCVCSTCSCGYGFTEQKVLYMEVDDDESGRDITSGSPYEYFEFQLLNKVVAWFYIDTVTFVEVCQGVSPTVTGTTATNSPSDIAPVDDIMAELNPGYAQGNVHALATWRRTSTLHFAIEANTPVRKNDYVLVSFDGEISINTFWSPFKEAVQVGDIVNENVWLFRFDADYGNEENWYASIYLEFIGSNWHRPAVQWVCVVEDPSNKGGANSTTTTTTPASTTTTSNTTTICHETETVVETIWTCPSSPDLICPGGCQAAGCTSEIITEQICKTYELASKKYIDLVTDYLKTLQPEVEGPYGPLVFDATTLQLAENSLRGLPKLSIGNSRDKVYQHMMSSLLMLGDEHALDAINAAITADAWIYNGVFVMETMLQFDNYTENNGYFSESLDSWFFSAVNWEITENTDADLSADYMTTILEGHPYSDDLSELISVIRTSFYEEVFE